LFSFVFLFFCFFANKLWPSLVAVKGIRIIDESHAFQSTSVFLLTGLMFASSVMKMSVSKEYTELRGTTKQIMTGSS
jgi:hypothetical protein